jgi:hypothetical protein
LPGTSTITTPVTARIHYIDVDALRHVATRDGRTVSGLIAFMVHDGLRREASASAQPHPVTADSA